jgi:molecular chaperone DnaK
MSTHADIVGIDLGTTNSLIGIVEGGFPIILADQEGKRLTPSCVHYAADGDVTVGTPARRRRATEPQRTILSIKRLMGKRRGELDHPLPYPIVSGADGALRVQLPDGTTKLPEEVSAEILRSLKLTAERQMGRQISRAVITVPAYFNDGQRQATKRAGELAGFVVERILNEPTAAALAYGMDKLKERSRIAVFDLGGGTFDLSILELNEGIFHVLATHGDTRLGGDDIDHALAAALLPECFPNGNPEPNGLARLQEAVIQAKHELSHHQSTVVSLPFIDGARSWERTLTREEFEKLARPVVERTRRHCLQVLADSKLTAAEVDRVLLVGGSTRIPLVRQIAAEIFGKEADTSQHPDEAIGLGAVIQAGLLCGAMQQMTLLDVTPLSLGIETFGGLMNVILPRNTTIPCKAGEMFTNAVDNQRAMLVRVLQGEREMARDNWELGQLEVEFEPGPRGSVRMGVQFHIDADGILHVLARDTKKNTDRILEIRQSAVQVDDERVEEMISQSVESAFEDMSERQWTEAKLKAEELLEAVEMALAEAGDLVDADQQGEISTAAEACRAALQSESLPRLKEANRQLDTATESLAAALVERAMEDSLRRKGLI